MNCWIRYGLPLDSSVVEMSVRVVPLSVFLARGQKALDTCPRRGVREPQLRTHPRGLRSQAVVTWYNPHPMRRVLTTVLLLAFCAGLALPFAQAQPAMAHACCAREGKHHCNGNASGGTTEFRSEPEPCPYRRHAALTSAVSTVTVAAHRISLPVTSETVQPTGPYFRSIHSNDAHKRGPPTTYAV